MKKYLALGSIMALMPILTLAATGFLGVLEKIAEIIKAVMPILVSVAVIFFIYSLLSYILKEGEDKAKAKTQMIWGIIILFAMISVWGLVGILTDTFGLTNTTPTNVGGILPTS